MKEAMKLIVAIFIIVATLYVSMAIQAAASAVCWVIGAYFLWLLYKEPEKKE
jgi:hypothetical protein